MSPSQTLQEQQLLQNFSVHQDFTKLLIDAFVLITPSQKILKYNAAFCQILELRSPEVRKFSTLDELLSTAMPGDRGSAIEQLLASPSPTRIDDVPVINKIKDKPLSFIMSSYPYYDEAGNLLGVCLLLRDVTAETNLQFKYQHKALESITDPLTGLYTRRHFELLIDQEIEKSRVERTPLSIAILLFDLDKFKNVNDRYGHQAGDYVLCETARVLKNISRRADVLGRYGGEELLVLLFQVTPQIAIVVAEKFRTAIEKHLYVFEGHTIPVTTSLGVTLLSSQHDNKEAAIKRADECLYLAKSLGRNATVVDFGSGRMLAAEFLSPSK